MNCSKMPDKCIQCFFFYSVVPFVVNTVPILVAAKSNVAKLSICHVPCNMTVASSSLTDFSHFAMHIIESRSQKMFTNQLTCVRYALMRWANTMWFDRFRCRVAIRMHGAINYAYSNTHKHLATSWSVHFVRIQIGFAIGLRNAVFSFLIGE